jgi:hypothetical protein
MSELVLAGLKICSSVFHTSAENQFHLLESCMSRVEINLIKHLSREFS